MYGYHRLTVGVSAVGVALLATACGDDDPDVEPTIDPDDVIGSIGTRYEGRTVSVLSPIEGDEADLLIEAYRPFVEATGIIVEYQSGNFEDQLFERIEAGNPPDLAIVPQPGAVAELARAGHLVAHPELAAVVDANHVAGWRQLGSVDGTFYAMPLGASVKSLVWYSPPRFAERGYAIPTTWTELLALSDQIVDDGGTPWCVGLESGGATGWPGTDWVEDLMLRTAGADTYDDWVDHTIRFDDPAVIAAFDEAAKVLKNESYIAGGVASQITTSFADSPSGLLDGSCYLHRQATFIASAFDGTELGPDGDIHVFYFPGASATDRPVLGAGELIARFTDRPEVEAVLLYLSSAELANARAQAGGWLSPHKRLEVSLLNDPIIAAAAAMLKDATVFRFDASDLMPFEVGAGTFWQGIVDWVGGKSSAEVTAEIEASWPS